MVTAIASPNIRTSKNLSTIKLAAALTAADKVMQPFRNRRVDFWKEYAGPYYGDGNYTPSPMNLIYSMVSTLTPHLFMAPAFDITSENPDLEPFADLLRLNCDKMAEELHLEEAFEQAVMDCMFGMGVLKVGIAATEAAGWDPEGNLLHDPGQPYVDVVDLDDYIPDTGARNRECMAFEANRFLVPFDWAMDSGLYKRDLLESVRRNGRDIRNEQRQDDQYRGGAGQIGDDDYIERVELCDVWLPAENAIITIPGAADLASRVLAEVDYDGPEGGPYETFGFSPVGGNLMPLPGLAVVYDLYLLINKLARAAGRKADRQKDLVLVTEGHDKTADLIRAANDCDVLKVRDASQVNQVSLGGSNQPAYEAVAWFQDHMNRIGGNLDLLGGLRAQANTLGQDEMNLTSASARINWLRRRIFRPADRVAKKMAWYAWTDPKTARQLTLTIPGGVEIPVRWDPMVREGDFLDYNFRINPYHKPNDGPEEQYQDVVRWLNEVIFPILPLAAQQGLHIDVAKLAKITGRMRGIREAGSIFRSGEPIMAPAQQGPGGGAAGGGGTTINLGGRPASMTGGQKSPGGQTARAVTAKGA